MSAKASSSVRGAIQIGQGNQYNAITKKRPNAVNTKLTSSYTTISKDNLHM